MDYLGIVHWVRASLSQEMETDIEMDKKFLQRLAGNDVDPTVCLKRKVVEVEKVDFADMFLGTFEWMYENCRVRKCFFLNRSSNCLPKAKYFNFFLWFLDFLIKQLRKIFDRVDEDGSNLAQRRFQSFF